MAARYAKCVALAAALAASGCTLLEPPAPQPDPMQARLDEMDRRLAALERMLASGALIELTEQVDSLQRQAADLNGRTETLERSSGGTAERQRALYVDLDDRVRALERTLENRAAAQPAAAPAAELPVPGGSDRQNYEAAFELLKQQRYPAAAAAFGQFLMSFPDSQLADNAQYWLAESYYVTGQYEEALRQFQLVLSGYPRSLKLPDALLKIGYSNYELDRWPDARSALERVRDDYPDSTTARLAEQRLQRMRDEGH